MSIPLDSSQHVHVLQGLYAAFARREIAALLAVLSADVEWTEPDHPLNPAAGTRHGHAGFLEWVRLGNESEEILALDPRQFLVGGDTVAVIGHTKCRVRATGKIYETDFVHVATFAGAKIVRFQEFFDTYAAGEAFRNDRTPSMDF